VKSNVIPTLSHLSFGAKQWLKLKSIEQLCFSVLVSFFLGFVLLLDCHEWSAAPISACLCPGHAAAFAVNAALMASQWQHRAWFINAKYDAGQAPITVFKVFGVTRLCRDPNQTYQLPCRVLNQLYHLAGISLRKRPKPCG